MNNGEVNQDTIRYGCLVSSPKQNDDVKDLKSESVRNQFSGISLSEKPHRGRNWRLKHENSFQMVYYTNSTRRNPKYVSNTGNLRVKELCDWIQQAGTESLEANSTS